MTPSSGAAGRFEVEGPGAGAPACVRPDGTGPAYPGVLLALPEAAWVLGISREELTRELQRGTLATCRLVRGKRVVAAVALKDVERLKRDQGRAPVPRPDAGRAEAELRERLARLEGELEASGRVERALQRYADKLEARSDAAVADLRLRLEQSRKREMTLARMLGAAEARLGQAGLGRLESGPA